ncbi:hypothetical protein A1O3_08126 [Capronia epimyces CBS 606.96]|uniref:Haloacid dehalogenase, type II n=1 Tax=Capronia epimyces CBS 606.96 TaxID=1182542 RepID=W9XSB1_9EURO|nr:uncharacterized protein A1O3_08126 [Capronia epimyces CBS 606.96]EXJ79841.1 hypothetical protein A1O3_08126 [Capronia epimyces CBS 606.96]
MATATSNAGTGTGSSALPMPEPTVPRRPLSSFKLLSFDIYGTLIDWERGILDRLEPLVARIPADAPAHIAQYRKGNETETDSHSERRLKLASKFNEVEAALQTERPGTRYSEILEAAYLRLARELGIVAVDLDADEGSKVKNDQIKQEARSFGASIGSWPAFPDTVAAMRRLRKHYQFLVPVSNVDRASFAATRAGPLNGVDFFTVYTAEDIGSYKPDLRNFAYLISHAEQDAGVAKHEILQVAQSLFHDHAPAKKVGLSSVWINRSNAGMGSGGGVRELHQTGQVGYGWRFDTLADFADEVERELAEEAKK